MVQILARHNPDVVGSVKLAKRAILQTVFFPIFLLAQIALSIVIPITIKPKSKANIYFAYYFPMLLALAFFIAQVLITNSIFRHMDKVALENEEIFANADSFKVVNGCSDEYTKIDFEKISEKSSRAKAALKSVNGLAWAFGFILFLQLIVTVIFVAIVGNKRKEKNLK